jgi:hypothetical protein
MSEVFGPQRPSDLRQVVRGLDEDGKAIFGQVDVAELSYKGRFGAVAYSHTETTIALGVHLLTIDDELNSFRIGDDVLVTSMDDVSAFMWAEIIDKDASGPTLLTLHVEDISQAGNITSSNWEIQVVARPKHGITKDTSLTSVDPTGAGPFTFTVSSGKFFPVGGKLLMFPIEDRSIALIGRVEAYSGTTLIVTKNATNATVSTSYSAWAIALLDAPQNKIEYYAIQGLRVTKNASAPTTDIDITAGSVRDSTDTVDLFLPSRITKRLDEVFVAGTNAGAYVVSATLAGTVTSAGTAVTGTGTAFLTDFGSAPSLDDLDDQLTALFGVLFSSLGHPSIINRASATVFQNFLPTTDTAGDTGAALGAAGATYGRGGFVTFANGGGLYAICLIRKDSDGSVDVSQCALNGNGEPDLPSGYTYYRVIAVAENIQASSLTIIQYIKNLNAPRADEVLVEPYAAAWEDVQNVLELLDDEVSAASAAIAALPTPQEASIYTPTVTDHANVAASTAFACQYMRIGDVVTVSGKVNVDPTAAAGTATEVRLTLPIASTFSAEQQLGGSGAAAAVNQAVAINGSIANRASFNFLAQTTANHSINFTFTYRIV